MTWDQTKDGLRMVDATDRFTIFKVDAGFYCLDFQTSESSGTFATATAAMAWAERQLIEKPFNGVTAPLTTIAGRPGPGIPNAKDAA